MEILKRTATIAFCCSAAAGLFANSPTRTQSAFVTLSVPAPIVPVRAAGRMAAVYELHVTNTGTRPLRVDHLDVRDAANAKAAPIASYDRQQLERDRKLIGPRDAPPPKALNSGVLAVLLRTPGSRRRT